MFFGSAYARYKRYETIGDVPDSMFLHSDLWSAGEADALGFALSIIDMILFSLLLDFEPAKFITICGQCNMYFSGCLHRACLFATAFLPTLKTNFFGNSNTLIERFLDCAKLITN